MSIGSVIYLHRVHWLQETNHTYDTDLTVWMQGFACTRMSICRMAFQRMDRYRCPLSHRGLGTQNNCFKRYDGSLTVLHLNNHGVLRIQRGITLYTLSLQWCISRVCRRDACRVCIVMSGGYIYISMSWVCYIARITGFAISRLWYNKHILFLVCLDVYVCLGTTGHAHTWTVSVDIMSIL